jgi:hypothetical protein
MKSNTGLGLISDVILCPMRSIARTQFQNNDLPVEVLRCALYTKPRIGVGLHSGVGPHDDLVKIVVQSTTH